MKNEESLATLDNVVYMQTNSNQEPINLNFRSKLIGGLNEEDVKRYISAIEDKYQQIEQEMNELVSSKNILQEELAVCKTSTIEEKRSLLESLEKAQNDLAIYVDECHNKDLALQTVSDEKNSKIAQLQIEIKQMAKKQIELEKLLSVSNQEFEQIMESAAGFEKENNILNLKIADLEKEISSDIIRDPEINKIVRELEQQIEFEKSRNEKQSADLEKIENDLAVYVDECHNKDLALQTVSDEKNSEIAQLQIEIKQMAEKQTELEKILSMSSLESEQIIERAAGFEEEKNILKSKIADLEKEISSDNTKDAETNEIIRELEQQIEFEKSRNEKQSADLEMSNQKIINLEEAIAKKIKEIEVQRKISEKAEQELKLEKARASNYKINGFKEGIENIYQQFKDLSEEQININNELQHQLEMEQLRVNKAKDLTEEQININNELQQQLEVEQLRVNKMEDHLAELINWVSELKDKLYNEQDLFRTQVKQLAERHELFQSEISGCFLNLEEICNI